MIASNDRMASYLQMKTKKYSDSNRMIEGRVWATDPELFAIASLLSTCHHLLSLWMSLKIGDLPALFPLDHRKYFLRPF